GSAAHHRRSDSGVPEPVEMLHNGLNCLSIFHSPFPFPLLRQAMASCPHLDFLHFLGAKRKKGFSSGGMLQPKEKTNQDTTANCSCNYIGPSNFCHIASLLRNILIWGT